MLYLTDSDCSMAASGLSVIGNCTMTDSCSSGNGINIEVMASGLCLAASFGNVTEIGVKEFRYTTFYYDNFDNCNNSYWYMEGENVDIKIVPENEVYVEWGNYEPISVVCPETRGLINISVQAE